MLGKVAVIKKQPESRIRNSVKNMASGVFVQMVTLAVLFIYRIYFVRLLGANYLGVSGLFSNILTIFSFAELGIGQAIVFSLYRPIAEDDRDKIRSLMRLYKKTYYCVGLIVFLLGTLFFPFYPILLNGGAENIPNLNLVYFLFVFNSGIGYFFSYRTSFLNANQKNYMLNLFSSVMTIIMYAAQLLILYLTHNYMAVLCIQVLCTIVQNAVTSAIVGRLYPYIKEQAKPLPKENTQSIIKNIKALIIYKIGTLALNSTDNIIISVFVGTIWVGYYSNYLVVVTSITTFASILFSSLTASIGNLNATGEKAQKMHIFNVCNFASFWIYSSIGVCFYIALNPFAAICFGEEYVLDKGVVAIIVANTYIASLLYAPFNYRQTMGLFVYGKWRPVISTVVNIVVSIVLAKVMGLAGVLLGTIVARVATNAWYDPYTVYKRGFGESPLRYYLNYIVRFSVFSLLCLLCDTVTALLPIKGLIGLVVKCIMAIVIVNGVIFSIWHRSPEVKYLVCVVKNALVARK